MTEASTLGVSFPKGTSTDEMLAQILSKVNVTPTRPQLVKLLQDVENARWN